MEENIPTLLHIVQAGLMSPQYAGPEIPSYVHHSFQLHKTELQILQSIRMIFVCAMISQSTDCPLHTLHLTIGNCSESGPVPNTPALK